jgi:hypothetical protein
LLFPKIEPELDDRIKLRKFAIAFDLAKIRIFSISVPKEIKQIFRGKDDLFFLYSFEYGPLQNI